MSTVDTLVKEIHDGLKQKNSSQKDEVRVMQAMLNDTSFKVGIYGKNGKEGEYCPAEDFKSMASSIVASTTKINKEEAKGLIADYNVSKAEAGAMVNISKQFINTYLDTGRKLPLGGREKTNFALSSRLVPEKTKPCPKKVGIDEEGNDIYEKIEKTIPEHVGLKAYGSCPSWVK